MAKFDVAMSNKPSDYPPLELLEKIKDCFKKIEIIDVGSNKIIKEINSYEEAYRLIKRDTYLYNSNGEVQPRGSNPYFSPTRLYYVSKYIYRYNHKHGWMRHKEDIKEIEIKYSFKKVKR
jgi:hypothetical protein